ncbi:Uracil DNA glycosylase [Alteracholeplasma palmae J233]|uniref:Uracil DNA glycosylase n=1 Tax=Alteracholeplasma palmae (strain ATCC 49389 / J233) TaxID=1318466 RepID=U4KKP2_ALTPJ|nr:uracil-DNA glycosylase family protein [Alteracholeplasma palmae]CCV64198.1 Uracil DNA glycosylase [Alteracholeplasma palmae J233]
MKYEIFNQNILSIIEEIKKDSLNMVYTKNNINPIYMANSKAKILIIGQAPGLKTAEKEMVFLDKSGDTLREWLGVSKEIFYSGIFAVLPLDFYYPGKGKTGDLPPRKEFAPLWHKRIMDQMPDISLTILIGSYAQKYYLGNKYRSLTETVFNYKSFLPTYFPIVHPSPLNFRWQNNNPWFKEFVVNDLKTMVHNIILGR